MILEPKESGEEIPTTPSPTDSGPLEVELVFPTQAIPLIAGGISESLLPICGPKMQLRYRCQFTDCTQVFFQKAAACTHICRDHLNVALACLYCSGRENPKMCWFSSSAWEKHVKNIPKMDSLYTPMTLLLPNCPLRLCPPPLVPLQDLSL